MIIPSFPFKTQKANNDLYESSIQGTLSLEIKNPSTDCLISEGSKDLSLLQPLEPYAQTKSNMKVVRNTTTIASESKYTFEIELPFYLMKNAVVDIWIPKQQIRVKNTGAFEIDMVLPNKEVASPSLVEIDSFYWRLQFK